MKKVFILQILCFCVFSVGCGGDNWITYEVEDFRFDIIVSEDRPALVSFLITSSHCMKCLKFPPVVFYEHELPSSYHEPSPNIIHLYSRVTNSSDCSCYAGETADITTEVSMWLSEGEYTVFAGKTWEVVFRINADSSEIVPKKHVYASLKSQPLC